MNMTSLPVSTILLPPLHSDAHKPISDWFYLVDSDNVTDYIMTNLWELPEQPESWKVVQLSSAVYVYREHRTGYAIVVKFHSVKTETDAERHAVREYNFNLQAREIKLKESKLCVVRPLGVWRGAIFLDYVNGQTLENKIAIRRSQPGELSNILENVGRFLASFHSESLQNEGMQDFGPAADYTYKMIDSLARHGVIKNNPILQNGFGRVIEKWAKDQLMWDYQLTLNHGDATTSNFIIPPDGGVVGIDWERSDTADPASDLGRLMAEVIHSVSQFGGNTNEGEAFAQHLAKNYCDFLPSDWNFNALLRRAQFYQATSMLRIARNGWLSHEDRLTLILQAFAILTK